MWRKLLIEKLGGYATAEDAIKAAGGFLTIEDAVEHLRSKDLKERRPILTLAVKRLFNTIGADDILRPADGGEWMFEGRTLTKAQRELLIAEAKQLQSMKLLGVLEKDIFWQVNRKMFIKAENLDHVITSQFWLYTFDAIRTRLKSLAGESALFNSRK